MVLSLVSAELIHGSAVRCWSLISFTYLALGWDTVIFISHPSTGWPRLIHRMVDTEFPRPKREGKPQICKCFKYALDLAKASQSISLYSRCGETDSTF